MRDVIQGRSWEFDVVTEKQQLDLTFTAYLRVEGRVTIPKELRDAYELKEGDLVECKIRRIR